MDTMKEKLQRLWKSLFENKEKNESEEETSIDDLEKYKRRLKQKKKIRYVTIAVIVLVVLITGLVIKYLIDHRTYDSYQVVKTSEQMDSSILQYKELGEHVLKYSGDGVSLLDSSDEVIWNDSIQMNSPQVVSFGNVAAIYETKGTFVGIYDTDGKLGEIKTQHPILKVSVSGLGGVAMLLENGANTLMYYYAYDGSLIASSSSNMKSPGYPVDLALSEDGLSLAVAYFVADGETVSSYLAFYNFGEIGKSKEDNLVDGFRFDGLLIPDVQYLDNKTLVVYREDGFSVYRGTGIQEEVANVSFEDEIISSFQGDEIFGFVFAGNGKDDAFELKVYNSSGELQMESGFDFIYDKIKVSGSQIILYNANQLAIIDSNGVERFSGNFEEGSILDVVKKGMNRYDVACDKGVVTIVLD